MLLRKSLALVGAFGIVTSAAACRTFTPPVSQTTLNGETAQWFGYDATRRGGLVYYEKDETGQRRMRVIAEPAPDAALETVGTLLASLNYQGADVDLQAQVAESIVQLGGRTQAVLILREALYRIEEMSINGTIQNLNARQLFEKTLEVAMKIAEAQRTKAEADNNREVAKRKEAELKTLKVHLDAIEKIENKEEKEKKLKAFCEEKPKEVPEKESEFKTLKLWLETIDKLKDPEERQKQLKALLEAKMKELEKEKPK